MQHWHGIHMFGYNAYDGGAFVNQCPIIPNNTFQYQFSVPDQAVRLLLRLERMNHVVFVRVHTGTTVTILLSIAMACEVHLLFTILKTH